MNAVKAVLLVLLFAAPAVGQCETGNCPTGYSTPSVVETPATDPLHAAVMPIVLKGSGGACVCVGQKDGIAYWVAAAHQTNDFVGNRKAELKADGKMSVGVRISPTVTVLAAVRAIDLKEDLVCFAAPVAQKLPTIRIATEPPQVGAEITIVGFPMNAGGQRKIAKSGRLIGYVPAIFQPDPNQKNALQVASPAYGGDSGGAMIYDGQLVGVLSGGEPTRGSRTGRVYPAQGACNLAVLRLVNRAVRGDASDPVPDPPTELLPIGPETPVPSYPSDDPNIPDAVAEMILPNGPKREAPKIEMLEAWKAEVARAAKIEAERDELFEKIEELEKKLESANAAPILAVPPDPVPDVAANLEPPSVLVPPVSSVPGVPVQELPVVDETKGDGDSPAELTLAQRAYRDISWLLLVLTVVSWGIWSIRGVVERRKQRKGGVG